MFVLAGPVAGYGLLIALLYIATLYFVGSVVGTYGSLRLEGSWVRVGVSALVGLAWIIRAAAAA